MLRLVNMHTAAVDNALGGDRQAYVPPGKVGEFDDTNPSVKLWMKCGWLIPEASYLASKAASLVDAPSIAELVALRSQVASLDAAMAAARAEHAALMDAYERGGAKLSEAAARIEALASENAALKAAVDAAAAESAELKAMLAAVTAPPAPAAETAPAGAKASGKGGR